MIYLHLWKLLIAAFLMATGFLGGCEQPSEPPPEPEPYFKPGEYGGDPMDGTEHLYNLQLSPDGSRIALIRAYTPGETFDPRDQLWILNADGTDPELIGYNIGTVDWSPDGEKLAVTFMPGAPYTYVFTVNVDSMKARQWTGFQGSYFSKQTVGNPRWFPGNRHLLLSVWGKAYQQPYKRGVYILNTISRSTKGPIVDLASRAFMGNNKQYFISDKYTIQDDTKSGNFIKYDFKKKNWNWLTDYPSDSLNRWAKLPRPNPKGTELIFAKHTDNAWQLFMMDFEGISVKQITELGGSQVSWSKGGRYVYFNRDIHKAPGARYIPHYYELATGEIQPLWPDLPDSAPQFPPLESQDPIDFRAIVQENASTGN